MNAVDTTTAAAKITTLTETIGKDSKRRVAFQTACLQSAGLKTGAQGARIQKEGSLPVVRETPWHTKLKKGPVRPATNIHLAGMSPLPSGDVGRGKGVTSERTPHKQPRGREHRASR